ncbi:MAG: hypothetical protein GF381_01380 [Candidatus Pacebacteria bacterium]|nr:hypothetical protein [Candidatus Paceibacterota bacterium]
MKSNNHSTGSFFTHWLLGVVGSVLFLLVWPALVASPFSPISLFSSFSSFSSFNQVLQIKILQKSQIAQKINEQLNRQFAQIKQSSPIVQAEWLESDSYVIQFGNFNTGGGKWSGTNYNLSYTMGQTAPGPYEDLSGTDDYFVGGGFQYIYQIGEFTFTISDTTMDLGQLSATAFGTDTHDITISTRGAGGYTIYAYEQHPLRLIGSTDPDHEIRDTECDSGGCTISEAKPWTSASNYGFGFNVAGTNVATDFTNSDPDCSTNTECFRPLADNEEGDSMQPIMSSSNVAESESASVTYQASIQGSQEAGNYATSIVFVAVPGY